MPTLFTWLKNDIDTIARFLCSLELNSVYELLRFPLAVLPLKTNLAVWDSW